MKNYRTFVVTYILTHGRNSWPAGRGGHFLCPSVPCTIWSCNPLRSVNVPAAVCRCKSKGSAGPFFISARQRIFFTGMTYPERKRPHGRIPSRADRPTHETGSSFSKQFPSSSLRRRYLAEKRAREEAYAYILYYGLMDSFQRFQASRRSIPFHSRRFQHLLLKSNPEAVKRLVGAVLGDFPDEK